MSSKAYVKSPNNPVTSKTVIQPCVSSWISIFSYNKKNNKTVYPVTTFNKFKFLVVCHIFIEIVIRDKNCSKNILVKLFYFNSTLSYVTEIKLSDQKKHRGKKSLL